MVLFHCSIAYNLSECDVETGIAHIQLNSYRLTRTLKQSVSVSLCVSLSRINCFAHLILGTEYAIETTRTGKEGMYYSHFLNEVKEWSQLEGVNF